MGVEIEMEAECAECGTNLKAKLDYRPGGYILIEVQPCQRCIEIAAEEKAEQHEPG